MSDKFRRERRHYPVLERYAYLDNATTGAIPQYACDAICTYLQERTRLGMDIDYYHDQWDFADTVRDQIAELLGAESGKTIAFGQNASTLFNIFCNGLDLHKGDNVVIYETAFPAMTYQWLNLKERLGIEVRVAHAENGQIPCESLFSLADEHTKAMTACFVDAGTGYRHDLKAIGSWCRAHNIPFGVDATQACGAMKLDVQDMQVDFLATSVYKWLQGLQGLGFAYISPKLMPRLKQYEMGWANVSDRINGKPFDLIMSDTACRFENGGLPAAALYGLSEVLHTYQRLGGDDIQAHILELEDYLEKRVEAVPELSMVYSHQPEHRSNLAFISFPERLGLSEPVIKQAGIRAGAPLFLRHGRVKAEDRIGEAVGCAVVVMLVGERPGLGQSESMSCYAVYRPTADTLESDRSVLSNIHREGTPPVEAAAVIVDLVRDMLHWKASGIKLNRRQAGDAGA